MKTKSFARKLFANAAMTISILTLLIVSAATSQVQAQDESCASESGRLKGVIVKMKDGRELVGYAITYPAVVYPTPGEDMTLYTEVYSVSKAAGFESKTFVTTEAQKLFLKADDVAKIIAARRPFDGQVVDWELMTVQSPEAIKWVTIEKPMAFVDLLDSEYGGRLISYNREIGQKELEQLSEKVKQRIEKFWAKSDQGGDEAWEKEWADIKRGLELRRVVLIEYIMGCC
ncbi:MAG: hypothetical protein ACKVZH_21935 [Blastocatellia bacterium]